ncbi:unnamed protein product, partial [Prorocentrum cordatum]
VDKQVDFCEEIRKAMAAHKGRKISFDNLDVSQVHWSGMTFSLLIDLLKETGATAVRWKSFKAGLEDEDISQLASWLEGLAAEDLPREIHLSHNRMTTAGFEALLSALEGKRAQLRRPALAIWCRVESNQLDRHIIDKMKHEGRICYVGRLNGPEHMAETKAVVAMPSAPMGSQVWAGGPKVVPPPPRMGAPTPSEAASAAPVPSAAWAPQAPLQQAWPLGAQARPLKAFVNRHMQRQQQPPVQHAASTGAAWRSAAPAGGRPPPLPPRGPRGAAPKEEK